VKEVKSFLREELVELEFFKQKKIKGVLILA
jgi:hypothetical protein